MWNDIIENKGPIARVIVRYGAGAIGYAGLSQDETLVAIVAALIGVATEAAYFIAKRRGWAT